MKHLLDMTIEELSAEIGSLGQPEYRVRQVGRWVWNERVYDFAAMTDLSAALRKDLAERFSILSGQVAGRTDDPDGTVKLLIQWPDGQRTESVLIPTKDRATACVSTQVGCAMGCSFCASGLHGVQRNLSAGEIVEQVLHLQAACDQRISHVVFMGMGEPLANYDATVRAIRAIIDPARLGISARHVTVSTIGLPGPIRRLAAEGLPVTLAISLHAPNDAIRRQIIPSARKTSIQEIVQAAEEFFQSRGRRITLEYVLLPGVNDTNVCATALARIALRLAAGVNLIAYNPVESLPFERPTIRQMQEFADRLQRVGVNVQIRRSRGRSSDAACGQLRRRNESKPFTPEDTEAPEQ